MTGRVIIVTGANCGIGFEAAKKLCEAGNDVILACRSEENGKAAVEKILQENPNALATFLQLDLADLASIRKFVEDFHALGKKLNVLVNNAGIFLKMSDRVRKFTKDNFELTMGTNYLGPFLLTHLLLDDLKKTASENGDSRIVMVASTLHDINDRGNRGGVKPFDLENFFLEKDGTYNGHQAYKNSKLAMVMSTHSLARKLEGTGVSVNCMCPGFIPSTQLSRHASSASRFMLKYIMGPVFKVAKISRTVDHGSKMIVELSVNEKYKDVSGKYFKDFEAAESSEESRNEEVQGQLYELSARYCHLEGYEPLDAPAPPPPEEKPVKSKKVKTPKKEKKEEEKVVEDKTVKEEGEKKEEPEVADGIKYADEDDKSEEKTGEPVKPKESEEPGKEKKTEEPVQVTITVEDVSSDKPSTDGEEVKKTEDEGEEKKEVKEETAGKGDGVGKTVESGEITAEITAQG
ncbi:retinol dehydrogenase 13-like [Saccostrea echinata]|uniref:retinol dehydrogenase 13-like n=1 Tax=Saccostrea echinata TaxID=191078 RepID=UPI002A7FAE5A|nr:retinol dehydrogenase 13-like [Saccostrea echinata]